MSSPVNNANRLPVLTDALARAELSPEEGAGWRRLAWRFGLAVGVIVALLLAWTAWAPLHGAVIAPGFVKTEFNRKTLQHQEGGIVREIRVREGQRVRAGEPLLVIADLRFEAGLNVLREQLASEAARQARLQAEAALAEAFDTPAAFKDDPRIAEYMQRERMLFAARRSTLNEQIAALLGQVRDTEAQIDALQAQVAATRQALALAREDLAINQKLMEQGFVQRTRVLGLERTAAEFEARQHEYESELALARQRLGDYRLRMAATRNQYRQQAANELKEVTARIREIEERLRPSSDQVERQVVRSPVDGEVMALRVSAPGIAVGPREPLLDVVPLDERLIVEARVRPEDIEHVRRGGAAEVRLTAYEFRRMPLLEGRILAVSPDRITDERDPVGWFTVQVEVDSRQLTGYRGARLLPGMPAEVYVSTAPRSLLAYLLEPLNAFRLRALREP